MDFFHILQTHNVFSKISACFLWNYLFDFSSRCTLRTPAVVITIFFTGLPLLVLWASLQQSQGPSHIANHQDTTASAMQGEANGVDSGRYVKEIYNQGDACDLTGQVRQTEVTLNSMRGRDRACMSRT